MIKLNETDIAFFSKSKNEITIRKWDPNSNIFVKIKTIDLSKTFFNYADSKINFLKTSCNGKIHLKIQCSSKDKMEEEIN